jgi:two-component system NtrC family sensor kinase
MRISTKVTLELVAAVAVLMAGFGYLAFRQERARLIDDLGQEALVRGSAIQFAVEQALRDRKIGDVPAILAEMAPAPRLVDSIRIFDRRLAEVSGTTTGVAGTPLVPRVAREQVLSTGKSLFRFRWDQPHPAVYVLLPLRSEQAAVAGILEVVVGADRLQRQVRDAARGLALRVGVLGLMIALAVWLAVGVGIRRPLEALVRAALRLGQDRPGQRIQVRGQGEIGQLASAFNRMAERLQAAHREIMAGGLARRELERQIHEAQKLAVVGRLASEVAHEIGTPLNIISGRTERIQKRLQAVQAALGDADTILGQIGRVAGIVRQLQEYARPRRASIRPIAVGPVLTRTIELLEPLARQREVVVEVHVAADLPLLLADPDQLQQVLLNLTTNALDATPPGGRVDVRAALEASSLIPGRAPDTTDTRPRLSRGRADEPTLTLTVADTGCGIPAQRLAQIFEPFFSTKERRGGTGLGMPIVEDILLTHHGSIEVRSAEGAGTTVLLRWPRQRDRHEPGEESPPEEDVLHVPAPLELWEQELETEVSGIGKR